MSSPVPRPTFDRRLARAPGRILELNRSWWRQGTWPERVARLSVIAGFLLTTTLAFVAAGAERGPAVPGLAVGAALLLLPAPWRWRSAGYVAALGFAIFFSNNAAQAADRPSGGWPLSLLALTLFVLSTWMGNREAERDEPPAHSATATPVAHDELRT